MNATGAPLLINGDCLEVMSSLPAGSVDMIFADLPYGCTQNDWDKKICIESFWKEAKRICKKSAVVALTAQQPFTSELVQSNLKDFRYDLVWHKQNAPTGFLNAKKRPLRAHESILIFFTEFRVYNAMTVIADYHKVNLKNNTSRGSNYGKENISRVSCNNGVKQPTSVINIPSERGHRWHPTQKPVGLLRWLIRTYTDEGMVVLDPTAGSMVTAIAAIELSRSSICIEKDVDYFAKGSERVKAHWEAHQKDGE